MLLRAVTLSLLLAPQALPAQSDSGPASTVSTILTLEERWRAAQHANDTLTFTALLAPDLTFIGTSGSLRDRADFIHSRAGSSMPRAATYAVDELRVRLYDSVAVVTGREATTGDSVSFTGRFTHVWARSAHGWRLVAIQRTDVAGP